MSANLFCEAFVHDKLLHLLESSTQHEILSFWCIITFVVVAALVLPLYICSVSNNGVKQLH